MLSDADHPTVNNQIMKWLSSSMNPNVESASRIPILKNQTCRQSETLLLTQYLPLTANRNQFLKTQLYLLFNQYLKDIMVPSSHMGRQAQEKPILCKVLKGINKVSYRGLLDTFSRPYREQLILRNISSERLFCNFITKNW